MFEPRHLPQAFAAQLKTARQLVEARRCAPPEQRLPIALPAVERLLAGGLRRGEAIELIGRRTSGRFSLVLALLAAVTTSGETAALVDLGDGFDPRAADAAGVELERLLWVRPRHMKEVLMSCEAILDSGMPLVVIDLGMPPVRGGRGHEAGWLRLVRAARSQRAALLISSPYRVTGTAAGTVLESRCRGAHWFGRGRLGRLLGGLSMQLELLKDRRRRPGARELLTLFAADALRLDSEPSAALEPPVTTLGDRAIA